MGCKSNQFEGQIIIQNLEQNGFVQVDDIKDADFYILNSCSVTHKSDNEALYLLRSAKNKNPNITTVATGCMAQVEKEKLLEFPYIDFVIGNDEKLNISEYLANDERLKAGDILHQQTFNKITLNDMTKTRAAVKIQDGCDNRCSYCIIWKARGKSRSADSDFIIKQINEFSAIGFNEVMLTGIHIGQWGKDFGKSLIDLLRDIEDKSTIKRFRLGSLNPTEIDDELLGFLQQSEKFCPHFHLSLQSANDKILKSMNRHYKTDFYMAQIQQINEMFDNPILGSDIITGFAGETDEDFEITRQNLEKSGLTQIHTFPYSVRKGTIGEQMPNQVDDATKNKRSEIIKKISKQKYGEFVSKNLGTTHEIIVEKHRDKHTNNLKGVTENYLSVQIVSDSENLYNTVQKVKVSEYKNNTIYAELI